MLESIANSFIFIKISSAIQLWLIRHPNFITSFFLKLCYIVDLFIYSKITTAKSFLTARTKVLGKNYAALGKIIVGEYAEVADLINSPQKRGYFLGRGRLNPEKFPKFFLLFISDEAAGGPPGVHKNFHNFIFDNAVKNLPNTDSPEFSKYLQDGANDWRKAGDDEDAQGNAVIRMTIKYVFHSLFNTQATEETIELMMGLFGNQSYPLGGMVPFEKLMNSEQQTARENNFAKLKAIVLETPLMKAYTPTEATSYISKSDIAEGYVAAVGLAGLLGTRALMKNIATAIPEGYNIDLTNKKELMYAVLEAARIKPPVNNVNVIMPVKKTMKVHKKKITFPKDTVFAASLGAASFDEDVFPDPFTYDHKRKNLEEAIINFNHVGYSKEGAGTRQCPGRNISMKMGMEFLTILRKKQE